MTRCEVHIYKYIYRLPLQPTIFRFPWQLNQGFWIRNDAHLWICPVSLEEHRRWSTTSSTLHLANGSSWNDRDPTVGIQRAVGHEEVPDPKLHRNLFQIDVPDRQRKWCLIRIQIREARLSSIAYFIACHVWWDHESETNCGSEWYTAGDATII